MFLENGIQMFPDRAKWHPDLAGVEAAIQFAIDTGRSEDEVPERP